MNDRVTDRAAAHATSAELAVRDWLLAGLSFATGIYEAICFLTFGKVFTAAQTGNLVLFGIGVAGTRQPAGPNPVTVVISLAAFAAGAVLATPILKAFDGDQETEDNKVFHAWPRRVSIALAIALILQVGFVAVWITAASPASLAYILMALSALAMGLQMNASSLMASQQGSGIYCLVNRWPGGKELPADGEDHRAEGDPCDEGGDQRHDRDRVAGGGGRLLDHEPRERISGDRGVGEGEGPCSGRERNPAVDRDQNERRQNRVTEVSQDDPRTLGQVGADQDEP
jgi:uncharacterized membrane protein YoaK (UPF0700 family)